MKYLANAFSLTMLDVPDDVQRALNPRLPPQGGLELRVSRVLPGDRAWITADCKSVVGHGDTAHLMADILGRPVEVNRTSVKLVPGDVLIVAQYSGPRLPEGTTELPAGARFDWLRVELPT
jgi:hypothetical protein